MTRIMQRLCANVTRHAVSLSASVAEILVVYFGEHELQHVDFRPEFVRPCHALEILICDVMLPLIEHGDEEHQVVNLSPHTHTHTHTHAHGQGTRLHTRGTTPHST